MEEVKAAAEPPPSPLILPLKTARHSDRREESASHKVASALGFTPEAVQNFIEEKLVFFIENMHDQATACAYNFQCTYNPPDKVVKIQIYVAVTTYCLVAIVEHDCQLGRSTFNVLRVVSKVLTDKTRIMYLFLNSETIDDIDENTAQLEFAFKY